MALYAISITEILNRVVAVKADSEMEAHDKVIQAYHKEDIVLDASDFVDVKFETEGDYKEVLAQGINVQITHL